MSIAKTLGIESYNAGWSDEKLDEWVEAVEGYLTRALQDGAVVTLADWAAMTPAEQAVLRAITNKGSEMEDEVQAAISKAVKFIEGAVT